MLSKNFLGMFSSRAIEEVKMALSPLFLEIYSSAFKAYLHFFEITFKYMPFILLHILLTL